MALDIFLSGVVNLFSVTLWAIMTQPMLVFFLTALLFAVVVAVARLLFHSAKKM